MQLPSVKRILQGFISTIKKVGPLTHSKPCALAIVENKINKTKKIKKYIFFIRINLGLPSIQPLNNY
jgi:hypothetical protein